MARLPLALPPPLAALVRTGSASAGEIVRFQLIPGRAAERAGLVAFGQIFVKGAMRPGETAVQPDDAHQPSRSCLPHLLAGSHPTPRQEAPTP